MWILLKPIFRTLFLFTVEAGELEKEFEALNNRDCAKDLTT